MTGTLRFTLDLGWFVRGRVLSEIRQMCFMRKLDLKETKLSGGILSSTYGFVVRGEAPGILSLNEAVKRMVAEHAGAVESEA